MTTRWLPVAAPIAGAILGAVAVLAARPAGLLLPWAVALPAGVAVGVLVALGARLTGADPDELDPPAGSSAASTATMADLGALHFAVQGAARDPDRFEHRIRPRLCALAADRLWQRHGLDWRTEADRTAASAVLGPQTWALLTAPAGSLRFTPVLLSRWLDELETL